MTQDATPELALVPVTGPIPDVMSQGAALGLGAWGRATRELVEAGFVPADVLAGMTLYLLVGQPRQPRADGRAPKGAVAGGVWVREQVTVHRPVRIGQELRVEGRSAGLFSRHGRRYGVNTSSTFDTEGRLLVSSCTTGLLRYRKEEALEREEGSLELEVPGPDPTLAAENPAAKALAQLRPGDAFEAAPTTVSLEMMRARDAGRDDNPIHTDPAVAEREGLAAPIAGGSHVLAFLNEALMRAWHPEALLYGAHFDVRWKAPTYAGATVAPRAEVASVTPDLLQLELEIRSDEHLAMVGSLKIPLAPSR